MITEAPSLLKGQFTCRGRSRQVRACTGVTCFQPYARGTEDKSAKEFLTLPGSLVFAATFFAAKAGTEVVMADEAKLAAAPRALIDRHAEPPHLLGVPSGRTSVDPPLNNTGRSKPRG